MGRASDHTPPPIELRDTGSRRVVDPETNGNGVGGEYTTLADLARAKRTVRLLAWAVGGLAALAALGWTARGFFDRNESRVGSLEKWHKSQQTELRAHRVLIQYLVEGQQAIAQKIGVQLAPPPHIKPPTLGDPEDE